MVGGGGQLGQCKCIFNLHPISRSSAHPFPMVTYAHWYPPPKKKIYKMIIFSFFKNEVHNNLETIFFSYLFCKDKKRLLPQIKHVLSMIITSITSICEQKKCNCGPNHFLDNMYSMKDLFILSVEKVCDADSDQGSRK